MSGDVESDVSQAVPKSLNGGSCLEPFSLHYLDRTLLGLDQMVLDQLVQLKQCIFCSLNKNVHVLEVILWQVRVTSNRTWKVIDISELDHSRVTL